MFKRFVCPQSNTVTESDVLLKRQLRWFLLLRALLLSILLGISMLLQSKEHNITIPPLQYISYFIGGIYCFTIASSFLLRVITCYKRFAYAQILTDTVLTSCLVFFSGGSQSIFTIVYFFPIIIASMLLLRPGAMLTAAVTTISYGAILLLEYFNYDPGFSFELWKRPLSEFTVMMHYFAFHGLTFFLVAVLSSLLAERLKKTEAALYQTTANYDRLASLYKQIFDDIGTGIITVDANDEITSFNPASENITGFKLDEVVGRKINDVFPAIFEKENHTLRPLAKLTRKDGEIIPVGYSWARLRTQDNPGNARVYTMQDLSQIKKMEKQVKQAEKMAAIGEMAASIAHEFRNPIAAVSGAAQLLYQESMYQPAHQRLMEIITRECDRLEKTIEEFLLFSKPTIPEKKWFSLANLTEEIVVILKQTPFWRDDCNLKIDISPNLDCWADQNQIKQVLLNLVQNALNATEDVEGQIVVSATEQKDDDESEHTLLVITDNGPGIPEKIVDRVFEPFFTTRENGTGLGLAIVKQIIESHHGSIQITANPVGKGTAFAVSLPLP